MIDKKVTQGDINDLASDVHNLATDVHNLIETLRARNKRYKAVIAVGIVLIVLVGWVAWVSLERGRQLDVQAEDEALEDCLRANDARGAIASGFGIFTEVLVEAARPEDPAESEVFEREVARFRTELEDGLEPIDPRDCNGDGVVTELD